MAAYLLTYFYDADQAATGKRQAYIGQLGTLPRYRGRGAGTALLAHALPAFRDAGYDLAGLDVDSANSSGALGLYQRLGFAVTHSVTSWERTVPRRTLTCPRAAGARCTADFGSPAARCGSRDRTKPTPNP